MRGTPPAGFAYRRESRCFAWKEQSCIMQGMRRIWRQVLGWLLIITGLIGALIPVMPQWPFLAAGAVLLAPHLRVFHRLAAWIRRRLPPLWRSVRRFRDLPGRHRDSSRPS